MSNLTKIPREDVYKATLTQALTAAGTTLYVSATPNFTLPVGETFYITINSGKSIMEVIEISAFDTSAKTLTATTRGVNLGDSYTNGAQAHAATAPVIISDNYANWVAIQTALGTKVDKDVDSIIADTKELQFGATSSAIWTDDTGTNLQFKDGSNAAVTLSTLAAGAGADTKVSITTSDTTTSTLDTKLTAGDGLSKTVINPAGDETLDLDIDLTDTNTFKLASSGAGDSGFGAILNASGKWADGFVNLGSATTANLTTLTDGSNASALHTHNAISSSSGLSFPDVYNNAIGSGGSLSANYGAGVKVTTGATSGNDFGSVIGIASLSGDVNIENSNAGFQTYIRLGATTSQYCLFGLDSTSNVTTMMAGISTGPVLTLNHAAFLVEDGSLYASVADGATQEISSAITGYTLTNGNSYRILRSGSNYEFYVNGVLEHTSTANNPSDLFGGMSSVQTNTTAAKSFQLSGHTVIMDI